jgi:hypothetical protein
MMAVFVFFIVSKAEGEAQVRARPARKFRIGDESLRTKQKEGSNQRLL